jgi:putative transcriptional regulator
MREFEGMLRGYRFAVLALLISAELLAALGTPNALAADLTSPSLLVATRDLDDPMFQRSVILMLPSKEPPLLAGVIINSPATVRVHDVFPQARALTGAQEAMYLGGPVEPDETSVLFRASGPTGSAVRVFDDVYVAAGHDAVAGILKDTRIAECRVIFGKAQWLRDQLHAEILEGAWQIVPARAELVFGDPKGLWSSLVKRGDLQEVETGPFWRPPAETGGYLAGPLFRLGWNLPLSRFDGTNCLRQILRN